MNNSKENSASSLGRSPKGGTPSDQTVVAIQHLVDLESNTSVVDTMRQLEASGLSMAATRKGHTVAVFITHPSVEEIMEGISQLIDQQDDLLDMEQGL